MYVIPRQLKRTLVYLLELRGRDHGIHEERTDAARVGIVRIDDHRLSPANCQYGLSNISQRALKVTPPNSDMPRYPTPEGDIKLSAAWLIERAGFNPGYVHGNVGTSSKHALAIINRGHGTAREVLELAEKIRSRVSDVFGVNLSPEPILVGFEK